eukprot:6209528-Pleurochrysis_carterae.AAC.2
MRQAASTAICEKFPCCPPCCRGAVADRSAPSFIINTGDSFYYCGLANTSDFQIQTDFVQPYSKYPSLDVPWYSVLGNHEYGYNVSAVIELSKLVRTARTATRVYHSSASSAPTPMHVHVRRLRNHQGTFPPATRPQQLCRNV